MSWKKNYEPGDCVKFKTNDEDFEHLNGEKGSIMYRLSDDDVNKDFYKGGVYRVKFTDGTELDAFDNELTKIPRKIAVA